MQPNHHSVSLRLLVLCPYISISLPYLLFQYILIYIICKLLLLRLICISAEFILFLAKSLLTHLNFYLAQVFSLLSTCPHTAFRLKNLLRCLNFLPAQVFSLPSTCPHTAFRLKKPTQPPEFPACVGLFPALYLSSHCFPA